MKKNLTAIGNSLGVVIEKPILELLRITRDMEIEISTDGQRLILEPVRKDEGTAGSTATSTDKPAKR